MVGLPDTSLTATVMSICEWSTRAPIQTYGGVAYASVSGGNTIGNAHSPGQFPVDGKTEAKQSGLQTNTWNDSQFEALKSSVRL